jgi:serine/threonine protein phosphatase PrpC
MKEYNDEKTFNSKQFVINIAPFVNGQKQDYKNLFQSDKLKELVKNFADKLDDLASNDIPCCSTEKQRAFEAYSKNTPHEFKSLSPRKNIDLFIEKKSKLSYKTIQQSNDPQVPLTSTSDVFSMNKPPYIPHVKSENKPIIIKPIFKIQNFKVNKEKKVKIDIDSSENISIIDVRFSTDLGLSYNKLTNEVEGAPNQAGDFTIHIKWSDGKGSSSTENLNLSVIDDPKNLWKNLESNKDDPYYKDDKDVKIIEDEEKIICAGSIRGRSHAHIGSFRDDDFFIYEDDKNNWSIIIVADGAGSAKCSRKGSYIACQTAGELIRSKIESSYAEIIDKINEYDIAENGRKLKEEFYYLLGNAFKYAVESIGVEAQTKNIAIKEYSTTLLASICFQFNNKKLFVASAMIGDGAIGIYFKEDNKINILGEPDSGEFAGQTRFLDISILSDGNFWERVNVGIYDNPTALLLMTDGISDPIFETESGLKDITLWNKFWSDIEPIVTDKSQDREQKLLDWMSFFSTGHHDDRTLAIYGLK